MNIGELKELIKDLPDDILVCGVGHFGEALEVYGASSKGVYASWSSGKTMDAFVIDMEDKGEEPN